MFGFDPVTVSAAYILASTACQAVPPPAVDLKFTASPTVERTDLSSKDLGNYHVDTTFSHSRNETFTVGGLTLSDFAPEYAVRFGTSVTPDGLGCVSIESVLITVNYTPTIFVASDYHQGTCAFQQVLQHEARHVNTDIITFNELLPQLKSTVAQALSGLGATGPIPPADFIKTRDALMDKVKQAVEGTSEYIEKVRMVRQQAVDTRQEYMRVWQACPGEFGFAAPQ